MKNNPQYLYELLREKRNKLARDTNVKPYMILQNKVLQTISEIKPATLEELGKIKGMGEKKLAKYGAIILKTINNSNDKSDSNTQAEKVFSVAEYIDYLNQLLIPQKAIIVGEISSVSLRENYTFFSLHDKEQEALLNCFVWKDRLDSFAVELKEGLELKVVGFPRIYEKYGKMTFEVEFIGLIGEGALKLAFEKLKKKLEAERYFNIERKKRIPDYIQRVSLITSNFGEAKNDFITHLGNFGFKINFFDVRVEGIYAIDDIISSIRWFNENLLDVEALVLTRGGGSLESLQAFNSEQVARAIFSSRIPIITGIGHENDITIADLVADKRASTPTDAARLLSDPWRNVSGLLSSIQTNMLSLISMSIREFDKRIFISNKDLITSVNRIILSKIQKLNDLQILLGSQFKDIINRTKDVQVRFLNNWEIIKRKMSSITHGITSREHLLLYASSHWIERISRDLSNLEDKLQLSSPEARLKHGYSIITTVDRKIVKGAKDIKIGDNLNLKFYQGSASSKVERIDN